MFDTTAIRDVLARASATPAAVLQPHRTASMLLSDAPQASGSQIPKPRKPRPGCGYLASPFRPIVLARDRIRCWSSPYAIAHRNSTLSSVPSSHAQKLLDVMLASLDSKTLEVYGAGLLRFTQYCDELQISEVSRVPASEVLLSAFIASWAGKIALTTVKNWLAGLHFWHSLHGAPWFGDNMLRITKGGVRKMVPKSSKREKRPPVTLSHMHALVRRLDMLAPMDAAILAATTTAFWGVCRLCFLHY
jgi:hypothetical protein